MTTQQRNVEIVMTQGKLDDILQDAYDRGYEAGQDNYHHLNEE